MNEPAFPNGFRCDGMTLRDYFAAKAMQGILATMDFADPHNTKGVLSSQAYEIADVMLKSRTEPKGE